MKYSLLRISDSGKDLNPSDLAEFLYLFEGSVFALEKNVPLATRRLKRAPTEDEVRSAKEALHRLLPSEWNSVFSHTREEESVGLVRLSRESPLVLTLAGCTFLIVLAVIFSGGRIKLVAGMNGTGFRALFDEK